jgi:hypothetical protein
MIDARGCNDACHTTEEAAMSMRILFQGV